MASMPDPMVVRTMGMVEMRRIPMVMRRGVMPPMDFEAMRGYHLSASAMSAMARSRRKSWFFTIFTVQPLIML